MKGNTKSSEDFQIKKSLKSLEEEINKVPFHNSKNISQLLKEEQSTDNLYDIFEKNKNIRSQKILQGTKLNKNTDQQRKRQQLISGSSGIIGLNTFGNQQSHKPSNQTMAIQHNIHDLGLDFLDVKKEIRHELKQVDKKTQEKYLKRKKTEMTDKDNTMVIFQDSSIQDLRIDQFLNNLQNENNGQLNKLRSKSSSPQIRKELKNEGVHMHQHHKGMAGKSKKNGVNVSTINLQTNNLLSASNQDLLGRLGSQSSLSNLNNLLGYRQDKHGLLIQNQTSRQSLKKNNSAIQKFIKAKKIEYNNKQNQEKQQEISKVIKHRENLSKLDNFVKKKLQQSFNHNHHLNSISAGEIAFTEFLKAKNKKRKNRSASRERKRKDERLQTDIEKLINFENEQDQIDEDLLIDEQKENLHQDLNIFNNKFSGKNNQKSVVDDYKNLDQQLTSFFKKSEKMNKKDNYSFTSARLKEFEEKVTDNCNAKSQTPKARKPTHSGTRPHVMKSMNDIIKRSQSQQRSFGQGFPQTSPNIPNRKTVFQVKNKIKTLDISETHKRKDQLVKKHKQQSISHRNPKLFRNGGKSQSKINSNKKKSSSKSRSKSGNRKSSKKSKSRSKSNDRMAKFSRSVPGSSSPIKSKSNSKSRSRSHSRSNKNQSKKSKKLNKKKSKKYKNSLSPENDFMNLSTAYNKNRGIDPGSSDFNYKKFMHGTIKISPRISKLTQYQKNNKASKSTHQESHLRRRRNRSSAKTQNQMQLMSGKQVQSTTGRGIIDSVKPKSQQKAQSQERMGDISLSQMKIKNIDSRNKKQIQDKPPTNPTSNTMLQRSQKNLVLKDIKENTTKELNPQQKAKSNKSQVNKEQIQEILRKINFDFSKQKKKKTKKIQQQQYIDVTDQSQQYGDSQDKLEAIQWQKEQAKNAKKADEEYAQQLVQNQAQQKSRVSKSQPEKQSNREQQKQLKELLKQIHIKNEELKIQKEMTDNFELTETLNKMDKKTSPGRGEVSSISSSKKNLERFSEKWVDMPNNQMIQTQQSHLKQSNRFSEMSGQQSQKSLNNFTFFDKQSSIKDFRQRSSDVKLSSQMQNTFGVINSSGGDQQINQQNNKEQNLGKLQQLYLNNLDMENSSNHSLKINQMPQSIGQQKLNKSRDNSNNYKDQNNHNELLDHMNNVIGNGPISNRSGRSAHSGIMAQIHGLANAGQFLRADNELFYPHLLNNQNQVPFTGIDSHRSNLSNKTYNLNLINQELMIIGSGAIGNSQSGIMNKNAMALIQNQSKYDEKNKNQGNMNQWNIKEKFLTADEKSPSGSLNQKGIYKALDKQQSQVESGSSKYIHNYQSNDNKLSSQMNLDRLQRFDKQARDYNFQDDDDDDEEEEEIQFQGKQRKGNSAAPAMSKNKMNKHSPERKKKIQNYMNESEDDDSNNSHSQKSLKISQINIDKTIESRSIPLSGERISNDEDNKNIQSHSQTSYERNYQIQSNSMPYSLISHKSQSHRSEEQSENSKRDREHTKQKQIDQKILSEMENGPHTLISHLNDPNNEIQMNDEIDIDIDDIDPKVKLTQQISPLDTNMIPDDDAIYDKNTPVISSAQNSEKQQTAENLLKYLDHKYKEKKQENSSQFDHSRASLQSDQLPSKRRQNEGQNSEGRASRYLVDQPLPGESSHSQKNHSNIEPIQKNSEFCFEGLDVNDIKFNLKDSREEDNAASPPIEDRSLDEIDKSSLSVQPKLNNPKTTPNQEITPIESPKQANFNRSDELDDYLDTNIEKEKIISGKKNIEMNIEDYEQEQEQEINQDDQSPKQIEQDQQIEQIKQTINAEMIITSNLTTLNLDGGDSSSDGAGPSHQFHYKDVNRHSIDSNNEEGQKLIIDQKYLEQFRKRQNRISEEKKHQENEIGIEIEIQENSPQLSEKNSSSLQNSEKREVDVGLNPMCIQMNSSPEPSNIEDIDSNLVNDVLTSKQPGRNINISDLLKNQDHQVKNESMTICSDIVNDLLKNLIKEPLSVEQYHEQLFSTLILKAEEPAKEEKIKKQTSFGKKQKNIQPQDIYYFISSSINQSELKHQIKQVIEMKQRQYVENDLIRSDDYINELLQYLLQFEMLTQQQLSVMDGSDNQYFGPGHEALLQELGGINYLIIFLKNLTNPIKKNLNDILNQLQKQEHGSYSHFESVQDPLRYPIIPIDVYLDVEKQREFEYQLNQQQIAMNSGEGSSNPVKGYLTGQSGNTQNTASILQESQHILNKSIFDAMNESLTKFRPYGIVGEPLPWSNKYRRLQTEVDINSVDTERLIQMVKQEVFRWMSTQQGALLHSHDTIFQYIDLQIPYMPEIQDKMIEEKQGKILQTEIDSPVLSPSPNISDKEETKTVNNLDQNKIDLEQKSQKSPIPLPDINKKNEETDKKEGSDKKDEKEAKEEQVEKQSSPKKQTSSELMKVQDQQFQKFKKTLIDDATQELRQSKLANQLQQEILEDEHFWLNYEFEETQIRIDLGDMILQTLLQEAIDFLNTKDNKGDQAGPEIEELQF